MKTLAFSLVAAFIFLFAFWVSPPPAPGTGASRPGEFVSIVPEARAEKERPPAALAKARGAADGSALLNAVNADNVCETARLLGGLDITLPKEAAALLKSVGAAPALQELYAEGGPLEAAPATPLSAFHHPFSRLAFALRLGNLYNSRYGPTNLARARELLLGLEKGDPGNAAYPFFLLDVAKHLGAGDAELAAIAARAAAGTRFETYFTESLRATQASRFVNAATFLALGGLLEGTDGADLMSPAKVIRALDKKFGTQHAAAVGALMRAPGLAARRASFFFDFSDREYDAGLGLEDKPGPLAAEISLRKEGLPRGYSLPMVGGLEEDNSCDPDRLQDDFAAIRNVF